MGKTEATEWERYKESAIWQYLRAQTGETNKIDISGWGTLAYDPLVKLIKVKPEFSVDRWKYKDGNHRANVAAATRANEL